MKKQFLEVGKIVNTHGLKGEMKVMHLCDSQEFLMSFDTVYLNENTPLKVIKTRTHKNAVLMTFEGINDINIAEKYKNQFIYIDRADAPESLIFQQDMIGIDVFDEYLNKKIGTLKEILTFPASDMFVIDNGNGKEYLVPDVEAFVKEIDLDKKLLTICTIEGLINDDSANEGLNSNED